MSVFRACLAMCGLTPEMAAKALRQSEHTVDAKIAGKRAMTRRDAEVLFDLFGIVRSGRTEKLESSVQEAAEAYRILRGGEMPAPSRRGRPIGSRNRKDLEREAAERAAFEAELAAELAARQKIRDLIILRRDRLADGKTDSELMLEEFSRLICGE